MVWRLDSFVYYARGTLVPLEAHSPSKIEVEFCVRPPLLINFL